MINRCNLQHNDWLRVIPPPAMGLYMATKKSNADKHRFLSWLGIAAIVLLLDQLTKITITRIFQYGDSLAITPFFNLVLTYNRGAAFSFLADSGGWQRYFFTAIALIVSGVIVYLLRKNSPQKMFCLALSLILGGAIGNLIDRLAYGHVIDFLDFYLGNSHWPAFNVADSAICVGAVLFVLDELRRVKKK